MAVETKPGGLTANRIEALLSARLFLEPQLTGGRLYFVSNLSGHLRLYAMDEAVGVPEPLLPPQLSLQNPVLVHGDSFYALPALERIVVMIDHDGDENYEPFVIPLTGGFPEPLAEETFRGRRSSLLDVDDETATAYFHAESREESMEFALRVDLETGDVEELGKSRYGAFVTAWTPDHSRVILGDGYTAGDIVLYEMRSDGSREMLYGTPIDEREEGREYPLSGIRGTHATKSGQGILLTSTVADDAGSPGYLAFDGSGEIESVTVDGLAHSGVGEIENVEHLEDFRYALTYNIDGCSWVYEASFDEPGRTLAVDRVLVGQGELAGGMIHGLHYDEGSGAFALSFCTATPDAALPALTRRRGAGAPHARARARHCAGRPLPGRGRLLRIS